MEIQTVKEIRDIETNELTGYLVDGTKSVPLAEGNRDYKEVLTWIEDGGIVEEAYTEEELESIALAEAKAEAQAYLNSTDWIIAKIGEVQLLGQPTDELVTKYQEQLDKRAECRSLLNG